ncbi:glutamate-cysteine ligase family protein [Methanoregula sp.]|uniref:glutamate-cysteine ligase family protein n=1 Tax=Methanoregula sp. TaxID=2052170 RepID=UPI0023727231|nr:glutamate-cysteine ligase family protein [Methanoregula sp.]MDD1686914.1 glutamate-cysteine ligase family protein [Methanoregula sp.]
MTTGTEHEYSINDGEFHALPVSDLILREICGRFESEILFGDVLLGKELQKTVLEMVPRSPSADLAPLEAQLTKGMAKFNHVFSGRYQLLGLGMHPLARIDEIPVWDHDEGEYYDVYDRLFNIRQHGWLNIQALQVNLSYGNSRNLVGTYNKLRTLLPYLIAVTASSPLVEGRLTGTCDNRLVYYRENQKEIPQICNGIIPAKIRSVADYHARHEQIFSELRSLGADILCEEWVDSGGVIIRFSRKCLEIKALDEQESIRSDMAVCAFVRSLLRCRALPVESDHTALVDLAEDAIQHGTAGLKAELGQLYDAAWQKATADERQYLPVIKDRIAQGSLAERMTRRISQGEPITSVLNDMADCLRTNRSYGL